MKTSIEIDEKKVKLAKQVSSISTLRELVDHALDRLIAEKRRLNMKDLLGSELIDRHYKLDRKK